MIKFGNPNFLAVFICAVSVVFFLLWAYRQRRIYLHSFADKNLINNLLLALDERKRNMKIFMMAFAVILCLFAFLRPQWGFYWKKTEKEGMDILFAIDTSKSMLAEDIKPNRLIRTKLAVKDLLKYFEADRVGLIAFSGTAFTICPLTIDYNGFVLALDEIDTSIIPYGGTSLSAAIKEAARGMEHSEGEYKTLVLISDGEDNVGGVPDAARAAKDAGLKIFCVGIGTAEGELIPITDDEGNRTFLKDKSGNVVKTSLVEGTLKNIALITEAAYVQATPTDFGLERLYRERIDKTGEKKLRSYGKKVFNERFQVFLGIAIMLLFIEPLISERKIV